MSQKIMAMIVGVKSFFYHKRCSTKLCNDYTQKHVNMKVKLILIKLRII